MELMKQPEEGPWMMADFYEAAVRSVEAEGRESKETFESLCEIANRSAGVPAALDKIRGSLHFENAEGNAFLENVLAELSDALLRAGFNLGWTYSFIAKNADAITKGGE